MPIQEIGASVRGVSEACGSAVQRRRVADNAVACMSCGSTPLGHKNFCRNCGNGVTAQQIICTKCGCSLGAAATRGQVPGQSTNSDSPNKVTAGLFAIFLGPFGIHKFYLGSWGWGIIYCVFTAITCGYGAIITGPMGLVEGIIYLTKSDENFAATYPPETRSPFRW